MNSTEALYNLNANTGNDLQQAFAVQRWRNNQWEMMGCKWSTIDEAISHARRLEGSTCRIVRITVEVVVEAFNEQNS